MPVTEARKSDFRDCISVSAFGEEKDARAFLNNNREKLEQLGFSEESEVQTLYSTKTGEVLGAYMRKRPAMTSEDAEDALDSLL